MGKSGVNLASSESPVVFSDSLLMSQLLLSKLSHLIRTPLCVAKSAIDDLSANFELSRDDIDYASKSMRQIVDILDSVRLFAHCANSFSSHVIDLAGLFEEFSQSFAKSGYQISFGELTVSSINFDEPIFRRVIHFLFQYIHAGFAQVSGGYNKELVMSASSVKGGHDNCNLSFKATNLGRGRKMQKCDFRELAQNDQRVESIGLFYVGEVARGVNGYTQAFVTNNDLILVVQL